MFKRGEKVTVWKEKALSVGAIYYSGKFDRYSHKGPDGTEYGIVKLSPSGTVIVPMSNIGRK